MNPKRTTIHHLHAVDTLWLGGTIGAYCTILWIGAAYDARWLPRAPWVLEVRRDSILRNERTGELRIYQFRDPGHGGWEVRRAG